MPDQELDYPFSGGVDEKTHPDLVEPGAALVVSNLRQLQNGSYQKRSGHSILPGANTVLGAGALPLGKRLLTRKDELLHTDNLNVYSYSPTLATWTKTQGLAPQLVAASEPKMALMYKVQGYDTAVCNGYTIMAACLPDGPGATPVYNTFATIVDNSTGMVVAPPALCGTLGVAAGVGPAFTLITVGNKVCCIQGPDNTAGQILYFSYIDMSSASTIATGWHLGTTLVSDTANIAGNHVYDVCALSSTVFAVAYVNNSVTISNQTITVRTFDVSGGITLVTTAAIACSPNAGFVAPKALSISGSVANGNSLILAYGKDGGVSLDVVVLNATTLAVTAATATMITVLGAVTAVNIAVTQTGNNSGTIIASSRTASSIGASISYARRFTFGGGTVTAVDNSYLRNYATIIESRVFQVSGREYCLMRPWQVSANGVNNDLLLVDLTQSLTDRFTGSTQGYLRVVANISPRLAYGGYGLNGPAKHVCTISGNVRYVCASPSLKNATSSSLDLLTFDWDVLNFLLYSPVTNVAQFAQLGNNIALSGAVPSYYDGVRCSEIGFFTRPVIRGSAFGAGGLTSVSGGYKYIAVYEQIDASGQWHQSNVSDPFGPVDPSVASGNNNKNITITVQPLQFSNRAEVLATSSPGPNPIRIALYRTTDGGNVYYRLSTSDNSSLGLVMNDPNADPLTFPADLTTDTNLGAPLYAQPGIPNTAQVKVTPPCFTSTVVHGDRVFGASGNTLWFSGQNVYGEGYWFADNFQIQIERGGDITGLASLDGSLVVFKRDSLCFIDGQGPPDNGLGGDYSTPQFIAADVGCVDPRSIVVTPNGVLFQSQRGLELLTRSRTLENYFGSKVQTTLAANPFITSALLQDDLGIVTFTCRPTQTSATGVTVTWDYVQNIWLPGAVFGGTATLGAILWDATGFSNKRSPLRTVLLTTGLIHIEYGTGFTDAGAYVTSTIVTPWIKMAGLQGYGRTREVRLLAETLTPCDITVSVEVDYRAGIVVQTRVFSAAEIATMRIPQLYMMMKVQKVQSIRFTITDTTPTGGPAVSSGKGATFVGLLITYSQKQNGNRIGQGR